MEKNPKYMYLEAIKKRVPLHSKKGYCSWRIGDETFRITAGIERMMVYALYVGHEGYNFYELARLNLPDYVSLNANPEFLKSTFEKAHWITLEDKRAIMAVRMFVSIITRFICYGNKRVVRRYRFRLGKRL